MKHDAYFVKQKNANTGLGSTRSLIGLYTLALVLALTGASSAQAAGANTNSLQNRNPTDPAGEYQQNGNERRQWRLPRSRAQRGRPFRGVRRAARATWWRTTPMGVNDVFVRDLQTGTTTLASVNRLGTNRAITTSGNPALSADGRFVAFKSCGERPGGNRHTGHKCVRA